MSPGCTSACLTSGHHIAEGAVSVPERYPEEFHRKVLEFVAAGRRTLTSHPSRASSFVR
jgi:hypothetical protein